MRPSHASAAIVLRTRAYGESDKIVTFLTADAGKLAGIAKGAKNSRRRFANCLDPFTRVQAHYRTRPGASLVFLESCDLVQPPGQLADPAKFAYGSYLVELIDQLTAEGQPVQELYALLEDGLQHLREHKATAAFLRIFELQALRHAGYDPRLDTCGRCRREVVGSANVFLEPVRGTVLCTDCRSLAQTVVPVTGKVLQILDAMKNTALADAGGCRIPSAIATEAANFMGYLLALHLPRPLRSVKLIAALAEPH